MPQLGDDPVAHRRRGDRSDRPSFRVGRNPNIVKLESAAAAPELDGYRVGCNVSPSQDQPSQEARSSLLSSMICPNGKWPLQQRLLRSF